MTREREIHEAYKEHLLNEGNPSNGFEYGARWSDTHPSDETIMLILNCIGYEEKSWIEFVRKELKKRRNEKQ